MATGIMSTFFTGANFDFIHQPTYNPADIKIYELFKIILEEKKFDIYNFFMYIH